MSIIIIVYYEILTYLIIIIMIINNTTREDYRSNPEKYGAKLKLARKYLGQGRFLFLLIGRWKTGKQGYNFKSGTRTPILTINPPLFSDNTNAPSNISKCAIRSYKIMVTRRKYTRSYNYHRKCNLYNVIAVKGPVGDRWGFDKFDCHLLPFSSHVDLT